MEYARERREVVDGNMATVALRQAVMVNEQLDRWRLVTCYGRLAPIEFEMKKISKQFNKIDIRGDR